MSPGLSVVDNQDTSPDPGQAGGGSDGTDDRLRQLEIRMARIETHLEYMPTKDDLESVKTLISEKESANNKWMIGVIAAAAITTAIALIRTFISYVMRFCMLSIVANRYNPL